MNKNSYRYSLSEIEKLYPIVESVDNSLQNNLHVLTVNDNELNKQNYLFINNTPARYILISDSYNNPYYPFKDLVYDKYTFDLPSYKQYMERFIFGHKLDYLPFHFWVEYINDDYYILNTRPIYLKPNIPDDKLRNSVFIMICGDSNKDIYPREFQIKLTRLLKSIYNLIISVNQTYSQYKTDIIKPLNIDLRRLINVSLQKKIFETIS